MSARKSRYEYEPCTFRDLGRGVEGFIAWCNMLITIQLDAIERVKAEQRAKSKAESDSRKADSARVKAASDSSKASSISAERIAKASEMIRAAALVAQQKRLGKK